MRKPQPNEHGVYEPGETLALPNPRPGWKGMALAEVDILELPDGWRSAVSASLARSGRGEPITERSPAHSSRDAAIRDAAERLRRWLDARDEPQATIVSRWLDTLLPDQLDLFGAAA